MFAFARSLCAAILVGVAAGCSADPSGLLADNTGRTATSKPALSRAAAERVPVAATAEAEAASNLLVQIFGSLAQPAAEAAGARLDGLIAEGAATRKSTAKATETVAVKTVKSTKSTAANPAAKTAKAARVVEEGRAMPGTHVRAPPTKASVQNSAKSDTPSPPRRPTRIAEPQPVKPHAALKAALTDVIVYDVVAGIRTLHRANGTVEEDTFDPATLPAIKAATPSGKTLIRIVNETNPASTGSTMSAQPHERSATIKAGPR